MAKSFVRHLGPSEKPPEEEVISFLRRNNVTPVWSDESGLTFRRKGRRVDLDGLPDKHLVRRKTRSKFQDILKVNNRQVATRLNETKAK